MVAPNCCPYGFSPLATILPEVPDERRTGSGVAMARLTTVPPVDFASYSARYAALSTILMVVASFIFSATPALTVTGSGWSFDPRWLLSRISSRTRSRPRRTNVVVSTILRTASRVARDGSGDARTGAGSESGSTHPRRRRANSTTPPPGKTNAKLLPKRKLSSFPAPLQAQTCQDLEAGRRRYGPPGRSCRQP